MLWGVEARLRGGANLAGSWSYQRNLRFDRAGLYSERTALDMWCRLGSGSLDTGVDYDLARGVFNEARVRLQGPLRGGVHLAGEARHREPFFELWTIWGAFAPVGFDEVRLDSWWEASRSLRLDAGGSYRDYREAHTGLQTEPIAGDGWQAQAGAAWDRDAWRARAAARLHRGHGAYRASVDASAQHQFHRQATVGLFASATQQFMEFRFGDGRSQGGGLEILVDVAEVLVRGSVAWYRHAFDGRPGFEDYGQWRASVGLTYGFAGGANADVWRAKSVRPRLDGPVHGGEGARHE
jgi:hypothetical protein